METDQDPGLDLPYENLSVAHRIPNYLRLPSSICYSKRLWILGKFIILASRATEKAAVNKEVYFTALILVAPIRISSETG